jgi:hypothetical protein
MGPCAIPEKVFRTPKHGAPMRQQTLGSSRSLLTMQSVFVKLVVDAAWCDPEKLGGLRLIAARLVQSGFEHPPFTILERSREVPAVDLQQVCDRGRKILWGYFQGGLLDVPPSAHSFWLDYGAFSLPRQLLQDVVRQVPQIEGGIIVFIDQRPPHQVLQLPGVSGQFELREGVYEVRVH